MKDEQVELRHAFEWTCPECGRDSVVRGVVPEMTDEDRQQLRHDMGVEDIEGTFMMQPDTVTCHHCGETFRTVHHAEGDSQ